MARNSRRLSLASTKPGSLTESSGPPRAGTQGIWRGMHYSAHVLFWLYPWPSHRILGPRKLTVLSSHCLSTSTTFALPPLLKHLGKSDHRPGSTRLFSKATLCPHSWQGGRRVRGKTILTQNGGGGCLHLDFLSVVIESHKAGPGFVSVPQCPAWSPGK
jgi:hypothetical protein